MRRRRLDDFIEEIRREVSRRNKKQARHEKPRRGAASILDWLQGAPPRPAREEGSRKLRLEEARPPESPAKTVPEPGGQPAKQEPVPSDGRDQARIPSTSRVESPVQVVAVHVSSVGDQEPGRSREWGGWYLGEKDDIVEQASGYVLDVKYDGGVGRAVLYFYLPGEGRLVRWYDRSDHRPYFLLDAEPSKDLRAKLAPGEDASVIVGFDVVTKFHPIKRRKVRLTKVLVSDPLAVRRLREAAKQNGIPFYEADIRYHHNYIYDKGLIPGMLHEADRDARLTSYEPPRESLERVLKAFSDEPEEVRRRAVSWIPLFEQDPPQPRILAVDIEVYTPYEGELPDPEKAPYPVVSIALADDRGLRKVLLLRRGDVREGDWEGFEGEVEYFDSEIDLILEAFRVIDQYPLIVTFNGDNFDIPYLYNRLITLGVPHWLIPVEFHQDSATFRNQLHVDLYKFFDIRALQVYAFGNKYREKNLDSVAEALLGKKKVALDKPISELDLATLARYNLNDAVLTIELMTFGNRLVWNLIVLLMRISKLGLEDVTRSQVSAWIRSLLHWEHRRRGYLIPSREDIAAIAGTARSTAVIKDKKYKGAIVLKPPQGVFFNILVLDFASLYPSVIKNWNLSYETVNNPECRGEKRVVPEVGHVVCMEVKGLTSEIVGLLRDFRVKIYKKRAKDKSLPDVARLWYNTVQAAMKVYINASYGVFGNESFNYYSLAVAESVTAIGRAVLRDTLRRARELGLMILYGDTDSIFVWDPPREKLDEIIEYVKEKHNLDLEIDKTFRLALFSGLKKNYIGITPDGDVVIKGMVGKKSNTPEFLKKEFTEATKILARINSPDQLLDAIEDMRKHIEGILNKLRRRAYTLDELAIRVMLSKDPKEYTKNTPQHVKAALLLRKYGLRVTKGTVVTYVKTRDKLGVRPVKLARLSEVDTSKYTELVKTVFEQMLMALGLSWSRMLGQRNLLLVQSLER